MLTQNLIDWNDVKEQEIAKRALEISASNGHHCLLFSPPGSGKTILAQRFITLLPSLINEQMIETLLLHALYPEKSNRPPQHNVYPPLRMPHHTCSELGLIGGGTPIKPGEISLAHNGVLFLDELAEFKARSLESLRESLEYGKITIARAANFAELTCSFQLIAAMNPCPCGNFNHPTKLCTCDTRKIKEYQAKLSGPLMDRIDLFIDVAPISLSALHQAKQRQETSSEVRGARVEACRQRQNKLNAASTGKAPEQYCRLTPESATVATKAIEHLSLSALSYYRILKVARTIADLDNKDSIGTSHLKKAISYRNKQPQDR